MGEYALYNGESVKLGTCESLYYIRYSHIHLLDPLPGNVNLSNRKEAAACRFRFPWPEEDGRGPGWYEDHEKGEDFPPGFTPGAFSALAGFEHKKSVQFTAHAAGGGLLLASLPCPLSRDWPGLPVKGNGTGAADFRLYMQRPIAGALWSIGQCKGCGALFRIPPEDGRALGLAYMESGRDRLEIADMRQDERERAEALRLVEIGRRVIAGYNERGAA